MAKNVKLPDGRIVAFPDTMSDDDVASAIKRDMGGQAASPAAPSFAEQHPYLNGALDVAKGAYKGALSTMNNADKLTSQIPVVGKYLTQPISTSVGLGGPTSQQYMADAQQRAQATNTAQKIGKGAEQIGEFFIPGGAEEALIGKSGGLLTKAAVKAAGAGLVNKAQGGSFAGGALGGAAGAGLGALAQKVAPTLAETALRMRGTDRAYGATPGQAILDHTKGISPAKVVESSRTAMNGLQDQVGNLLGSTTAPVDLAGVRTVAGDAFSKALEENEPKTIKSLASLADQVTADGTTGQTIPRFVPAPQAASLNRGIANARTSWNPATANDSMKAAGGMMHHALGDAISDVAPEVRPLNQQIQSLIPVVQRGTAADLNAGFLQRSVGRFGAHTGALAAGLAGFHFGGVPGAVAGTLGPELIASPEAQMAAARAINSPSLRKIGLPALNAASQQFFRGGSQQ